MKIKTNIVYYNKIVINLMGEWRIWSQCFGKILVLNGVSSSGKTTLSRQLEGVGFNIISMDDIWDDTQYSYLRQNIDPFKFRYLESCLGPKLIERVIYGYKIPNKYSNETRVATALLRSEIATIGSKKITTLELYDKMYDKSKQFLFRGENVVIDVVCQTDDELSKLAYCYHNYPMVNCLVFATLEDNLKNCLNRNYQSIFNHELDYRHPVLQVLSQYRHFYTLQTQEDNNASQVLDRIEKTTYSKLLNIAEYHGKRLCEIDRYLRLSYEEGNDIKFLNQMRSILKLFKGKISPDSEKGVVITPSLGYDCIFRYKEQNTNTEKLLTSTFRSFDSDIERCYIVYGKDSIGLPKFIGNQGEITELEFTGYGLRRLDLLGTITESVDEYF